MKIPRSLFLACCLLLGSLSAQTPAAPATPADPSVGAPRAATNKHFFGRHETILARGKAGPIGVLFLGDSITEGWNQAPHIWEHYYGQWQPANFGISGDQTQQVIWRIENGELNGVSPRVLVYMLGTNNSGAYTAEQIAAANRKIVAMIRERLPQTKILLLAIFPRGPRNTRDGTPEPWEQRMAVIRGANADLAKLDDGKMIRFLDINAAFLGNDGTIPNTIMPDQLHPNAAGYQLWADAMQPLLKEMMQ